MADNIDTLAASQEKRLTEEMEAAFLALLATIDSDQLAASLDDIDGDHIRAQLGLLLELDQSGTPQALAEALSPIGGALASFIAAVVALAASQARHSINSGSSELRAAQAAGPALVSRYLADTATAIKAAIEAAIYGVGTPDARAKQLKRSVGLTVRQAETLDVMASALQRFLDTPPTLVPARTDANGARVPGAYVRQANTRAILARTRGRISAAQLGMLARAMANPKLTQAEADAMLDRHAAKLRSFRIRSVSSQAVHELTEAAKLAGWQAAQRAGALPTRQRRYWHTAGDERVRHTHAQVPELNPAGVALTEPFSTPFGPRMNAPLEWGCRCKAVLGSAR